MRTQSGCKSITLARRVVRVRMMNIRAAASYESGERCRSPRKMTKTQCAAKGFGPVLAMEALLLLAPSLVNGLHCPLPVSNSKH